MRTLGTIGLVILWLPLAFLATGIVYGLLYGSTHHGLGASGAVLASVLWLAGAVWLVRRRRVTTVH